MEQLTDAKLKEHFYGQRKFRNFNGNFEDLIIGIETEFLIEKKSQPLQLMTETDWSIFSQKLIDDHGYRTSNELGRLSKEMENGGYITIKPDFSFNNLEISFPPRQSRYAIESMFIETISYIDEILTNLGLQRAAYSVVPSFPISYDLLPLERHNVWLSSFEANKASGSPFYCPSYPAIMSSLQVHLNILNDDFFSILPALYEIEWLVPIMFSNSKIFNGEKVRCARILLLEDTLGESYSLGSIPKKIPRNISEYRELFNSTPQLFPDDVFFPAKDYTLVRPRNFGTAEFRSACSQNSIEDILRVCAFRVLQLLYGINYAQKPINSKQSSREIMRQVAINTDFLPETTDITLSRLRTLRPKIPTDWLDLLLPLFDGKLI